MTDGGVFSVDHNARVADPASSTERCRGSMTGLPCSSKHADDAEGGGAEGVGRATTSAVVISGVLILTSDYFLTRILAPLGVG